MCRQVAGTLRVPPRGAGILTCHPLPGSTNVCPTICYRSLLGQPEPTIGQFFYRHLPPADSISGARLEFADAAPAWGVKAVFPQAQSSLVNRSEICSCHSVPTNTESFRSPFDKFARPTDRPCRPKSTGQTRSAAAESDQSADRTRRRQNTPRSRKIDVRGRDLTI